MKKKVPQIIVNYPDDEYYLRILLEAEKLYSAVRDFANVLRSKIKYEEHSSEVMEELYKLREAFYECLEDVHLEF